MVIPVRYWALNPSTNSRTPLTSVTKSSSSGRSSMLRLYLKPEHPPGQHAHPKAGALGGHLLLDDELPDLLGRPPRHVDGEPTRRGLLVDTAHWIAP